MAFDASGLSVGSQLIGGRYRTWVYLTSDPLGTVDDTDYFALMGDGLAGSYKMALGDFIIVERTTNGTVALGYVSAVDADYNATYTALAFGGAIVGAVTMDNSLSVAGSATFGSTLTVSGALTRSGGSSAAGLATFTSVTATGDVAFGDAAADLLGFHGTTAISQRAGSNQATTAVVTSASFGTRQVAQLQEVQNVLITLGLMKGAA